MRDELADHPDRRRWNAWCLRPGEPAVLLPAGFTVVQQADLPQTGPAGSGGAATWRRLLARRGSAGSRPLARRG